METDLTKTCFVFSGQIPERAQAEAGLLSKAKQVRQTNTKYSWVILSQC